MTSKTLLNPPLHFQTLPPRDPQDGQRGRPEPADVLLARAAQPRLPKHRQLEGKHEHGDAGDAARLQDPRHPRAAVGQCHTEGPSPDAQGARPRAGSVQQPSELFPESDRRPAQVHQIPGAHAHQLDPGRSADADADDAGADDGRTVAGGNARCGGSTWPAGHFSVERVCVCVSVCLYEIFYIIRS